MKCGSLLNFKNDMKKMIKKNKSCSKKGFSVLEIILAVALFSIFSTTAISFVLEAMQSQSQAQQFESAVTLAEDGIEKTRAVRNVSFDDLIVGNNFGLQFSDGKWQLKADGDESGIYERTLAIETVKRNGDGDIVTDGDEDLDMKKVVVNVSWKTESGQDVSTEMITYLSRWK